MLCTMCKNEFDGDMFNECPNCGEALTEDVYCEVHRQSYNPDSYPDGCPDCILDKAKLANSVSS